MQQSDILHLLVSSESQPQLEACVGLFRDAGWSVRAHRVTSMRDLADMLRDPQWDLLIASDRHPEVSPAEALAALSRSSNPLPCIVRAANPANEQCSAWLHAGARDVIAADQADRLLLASLREIEARREHRELEALRISHEEIARRVELLLAASQDAIAYVVDGMHVHANDVYAELFGHANVEELASIPLIDLIAADGQQQAKEALRHYRDNPEKHTSIDFAGIRADGSEFPGQMVLSTASFEGEPCMQVMVRAVAPGAAAPAAAPVAAGACSGGVEALAGLLSASSSGQLLLVGVDGYAQHCRNLGVHGASRLINELGEFIANTSQWPALKRVGDATLALNLATASPDQAVAEAQRAVAQVAEHIHEIDEQSVTGAISVIVYPLDSTNGSSASTLIDRAWSALLDTAERAQSLRGTDPGRVQLVRELSAEVAPSGSEQVLSDALQTGEFQILFQPMISLRGDASEYYEVQVFHAPSSQSAAEWLAGEKLGERSAELDQWVMTESLKKLAAHRPRNPDTRLVIPIGQGSVMDADFPSWLAAALRAAELPGDVLVVQLDHRTASTALRQAKALAERLRALGCQLAISAVHSANNPLPDLAHLSPQFARIDISLAQALTDSDATNTLLKPLVESLHQEKIVSIMPGVESAGVMAVLWQLGVNFIQGNYLQAPSPDMQYEFTDLT